MYVLRMYVCALVGMYVYMHACVYASFTRYHNINSHKDNNSSAAMTGDPAAAGAHDLMRNNIAQARRAAHNGGRTQAQAPQAQHSQKRACRVRIE
jgi:uncharacterized membrane protein YjfL (UPF0719 family)